MLSVLIPSRNERFLNRTMRDIFEKAEGDLEIIAVIDEKWPDEVMEDPRIKYIHPDKPGGLRNGINLAVEAATGEHVMKCDAHCMFDQGFDVKLAADCEEDWLVIPSRYSLLADDDKWEIANTGKSRVDYHYLSFPLDVRPKERPGLHGRVWNERARSRKDKPEYEIDDEMSFQGSCWFANRKYFMDNIYPMQEEGFETFIAEPQEIGIKYWLGGGRTVVNKKTWYAHLHKGKKWGRGYFIDRRPLRRGNAYSCDYFMNNRWEDRKHDLSYLIERFWPIPGWPEDWEKQWAEHEAKQKS